MSQEGFVVLQKENHALIRENNALHLEIIRIQEDLDAKSSSMAAREKTLEHKIQELQFLNTQKTAQLQKKDGDLAKLYAQVQRLRNEHPGGGGATNESIELNKPLPPHDASPLERTSSMVHVAAQDDIDMISNMQLEALGRENKALMDRISTLEAQVRHREGEIERLGTQLKASVHTKDYATVKAKYDLEAAQLAQDIEKEQLTRQVDLLNDQVAKYEHKLEEARPAVQRVSFLTHQLDQAREANATYIAELSQLRQQYQRLEEEHLLCTSKQTEAAHVVEDTQGKASRLDEELRDARTQITRLEHALQATHYDKVSSSNAVANLEAHAKVVAGELNQLKPKYRDALTQLSESQSHNKQLSRQLETLEKELTIVQTKLTAALADQQKASEADAARQRECAALENVVLEREKQVRQLKGALESAQHEALGLETRLQQSEALHTHENQRSTELQQQHASVYSEERAALRKDNETLRVTVRQLDVQRKDAEKDRVAAETQLELLRRQHDQDQTRLTETLHDVQQLQTQLKQLKIEVVHVQEEKAQVETQLGESRRQVEKMSTLPSLDAASKAQDGKWHQRLQELLLGKQQVETQLSAAMAAKTSVEQQLAKCTNELRQADEFAAKQQSELAHVQRELINVQSELASMRQSKMYFEKEYEAAMQAWTEQTKEMQSSQYHASASQVQQQDLARQLQECKAALQKAQTKCHQLESLLGQAQTSRKSLEMQWTLAQEDARHAKENQLAREAQLKRLQVETTDQAARLVQLEQDNGQLKHVVAEMDYARDNWQLKQKQLSIELAETRDAKAFVAAELAQVQENEQRLKDQVQQMKSILHQVDREKDKLIDTLDRKTEELSQLHEQTTTVTNEQAKVRGELQQCQLALHRLEGALAEKEALVQSQVAQLSTAESTTRALKQDVDLLRAEQVALQQDLHHMTIENQSLAGECATLHHELDQVSGDQRGLHGHVHQVERERDAIRIELDDLKQTYRALVVEMDALEVTRAQLSATRDELGMTTTNMRRHIQDLTRERDEAVHHATELTAEQQVYMTQIKQLTLQLQQLQGRGLFYRQATQARSEALLSGALNSQQQVATELAHERVESAAHHSSLNQRLAYLQAQLNNSVHDRTQLTAQVADLTVEKQRLESLLASVRSQLATLQVHVQQQQEDKTALVEQLARAGAPKGSSSSSSPALDRRSHRSSSPGSIVSNSYIPTMQEAEERCRSLEERLSRQDATIQQLEHSRSKFRKFAAKYEVELEQAKGSRDRSTAHVPTIVLE
ncbi:Aste57867_24597 [Aphanomyces stellatus]|uniref:Aste57867_24597 protein n=1 Tax=Aphanomyces stellatus TaxID=120398 RepID=A0A485LQW5_9STRA|nr:hypothetical protein As57867_024519 [Aphanomyces stellatus]VFU01235.1 Aste57867_24597 [Aphanomyces stellatus]